MRGARSDRDDLRKIPISRRSQPGDRAKRSDLKAILVLWHWIIAPVAAVPITDTSSLRLFASYGKHMLAYQT